MPNISSRSHHKHAAGVRYGFRQKHHLTHCGQLKLTTTTTAAVAARIGLIEADKGGERICGGERWMNCKCKCGQTSQASKRIMTLPFSASGCPRYLMLDADWLVLVSNSSFMWGREGLRKRRSIAYCNKDVDKVLLDHGSTEWEKPYYEP